MLRKMIGIVAVVVAMGWAAAVMAAPAVKTYQVTGPVLELTDTKIVIQKDTEKWELVRTADLKVTGELKVGAKVTVKYTMTATSVDVKK